MLLDGHCEPLSAARYRSTTRSNNLTRVVYQFLSTIHFCSEFRLLIAAGYIFFFWKVHADDEKSKNVNAAGDWLWQGSQLLEHAATAQAIAEQSHQLCMAMAVFSVDMASVARVPLKTLPQLQTVSEPVLLS